MVELEGNTDVTQDAGTSVTDSSPVEGGDNLGTKQDQASADSVNTVEDFADVPFNEHPRFKQLIEQKNKSKKELDEYKKKLEEAQKAIQEKDEVYKPYQDLDKEMRNNPALSSAVNKIIADYNEGRITQAQAEKKIETAENKYGSGTGNDGDYNSAVSSIVVSNYLNDFDSLMEKEGFNDNIKKKLEAFTGAQMTKLNPNANKYYDRSLVKNAYGEIKGLLDEYADMKIKQFIESKKNDVGPSVKTGATVSQSSGTPKSRADRIRMVADTLIKAQDTTT